jgi:DNA-binding winged helix-turn-helix (wHTH) protein/tetratricopeptide (TPR) repeat protein
VITIKFTPFTLDPTRGLLLLNDEPLPLRRQSFVVLRYLAERRGRAIASAEITAALWATPPANPDGSLTQCVKDIRRALGPDHHWMVRTVSGVGYEFMPEVTVVSPETPAPAPPDMDTPPPATLEAGEHPRPETQVAVQASRWSVGRLSWAVASVALVLALALWYRAPSPSDTLASGAPLTMMATPSIALLPATVVTDNGTAGAQTLADDIASELRRTTRGFDLTIKVAAPSQVRDLSVESLSRDLDVRYVLKTSVRDEAGVPQLVVQLFEGPTGHQVWAAPFTQPTAGTSSQNLMAARIARALAVQLRTAESLRPLPARPQAGHFILQGRVLLEGERDADVNTRAMDLFDKALALDPKNLQALMGYARTRVADVGNGWVVLQKRSRTLDEASAAMDLAISLDRSSVGAHMLRGSIEQTRGNFDRAVASYEYARSLNPNYALVHGELGRVKIDLGQPLDALAHIEQALTLSPTDPVASIWFLWAGMAAAQAGDFKASLAWMLKAQQANVRNKNPRPWLAIAYAKLGDQDKARQLIREHIAEVPKFSVDEWTQLITRGNARSAGRIEPFAAVLRALSAPARP